MKYDQPDCHIDIDNVYIQFLWRFSITGKVNNRKRNGIDCTENVREMKSITSSWATVDFSANTKEKALLMPVFILIESEYQSE